MSLKAEDSIITAYELLKAKDREIDILKDRVEDLNKQLKTEIGFSENLNDLNIQLKQENKRLRHRLKLQVHPKAIEQHQNVLVQKQRLKKALNYAIGLIPESDQNKREIDALKQVFQENV